MKSVIFNKVCWCWSWDLIFHWCQQINTQNMQNHTVFREFQDLPQLNLPFIFLNLDFRKKQKHWLNIKFQVFNIAEETQKL